MNTGFRNPKYSGSDKNKLKERTGTAEAIYYIEETVLRKMQLLKEQEIWKLLEAKKKEELDRNYEAMRQKGISVIPWGEKEYPGRLKEIYDPPYALYVKGKLPDNTARAAAIVGARSCTPYGEKYALEYGKKLAECGIQVISGLARGVDGSRTERCSCVGGGKYLAVWGAGRCLLSEKPYGIISGYPGAGRRDPFRTPARHTAASAAFSEAKPDHQRAVRYCARYGGKREEWITDHSRSGTGAGKGCLCAAGAC